MALKTQDFFRVSKKSGPISDMSIFPKQICIHRFLPLLHSVLIILFLTTLLPFFHPSVQAKTFYSIRLGSYKDKKEAVKMLNELKKLGHNAFIKTVNLKDSGTWHRVYIERYDTRAEAVKEARVFKKLELIFEFGIDPIYEKDKTEEKKPAPKQKVFFLHVYSFEEKENAEKNVEILNTEGQKAFFVKEEIKGRDWYRVYIGEFSSEQSARQTGTVLKEKGLIHYFKPIEIDQGVIDQEAEKPPQPTATRSGNGD